MHHILRSFFVLSLLSTLALGAVSSNQACAQSATFEATPTPPPTYESARRPVGAALTGHTTPAHVYRPRRGRAIVAYRTETRNPPALWGAGLGLFLGGWVLHFAALTPIANAVSNERSNAAEQDAQAWALVPIAGPLAQLGLEAPHPAIPILAGALQIGGIVLFALGLTTTEQTRVPIYEGSPEDPSMLTVELDGGASPDGAFVGLTLRHL
jgi:hypothetical protein